MSRITNITHFKSLKYGLSTILFALIPVVFAIILFQIFFNVRTYHAELQLITTTKQYDIQKLLYYLIGGLAHITICTIITAQFSLGNKRDLTAHKAKVLRRVRTIAVVSVFVLIYLLDTIHINLAYLSHDRLYTLMSRSEYFSNLFKFFPESSGRTFEGWHWFHLFSTLPFLLICVALSVMVFAGFYIGNELHNFVKKESFDEKRVKDHITDLNILLKKYAQLLSIVMVSSTITTILFFQLPVPLIQDLAVQHNFSQVSMTMGICWGVIFSLTLLFLCIYPYQIAHRRMTTLLQEQRIKNNAELEAWMDQHKNYFTFIWNLKLLTSIISPAAAGILTTIISGLL
jgi:hypothetical protein